MIPNKKIQKELAEKSELLALIEPNYLKKTKNYHFILERIYGLTEGNTKIGNADMLTLLVETGLFSSISGAYSDVIGTNSIIDSSVVRSFIESFIASDSVAIKAVSDGKTQTVEVLPAGSFYETISETGEKIPHEIVIYEENKEYFAFIRSFFEWYNENRLYKMDGKDLEWAKEIPLSSLSLTQFLPEKEYTGLEGRAIAINKKGERFFEKILTLAFSIDRKMNELEAEFYKHTDAFVIFNGIDVPDEAVTNGKIDKMKMGKMFFSSSGTGDIKFVTNNNPMIEKSMEFIRKDIDRISSITKVPIEFLGEAMSEWAVGAESRKLRMSLFYAKVINMREAIEEMYEQLFGKVDFIWSEIVGYNQENNEQNTISWISQKTGEKNRTNKGL